ncbi:MAG: hypothetical protein KDC54_23460 [Lewinella sp.]|nr:hypothetical protein [Lewinella sp.]
MQKSFIALIVLWLPILLSAQVITVSEDITLNNDAAYEVLGELGNHILLFRDAKTEFSVQAFNQQMRESWTKELELDRRNPRVLGVIPTREDFTLIYQFRDKGHTIIKAHRYDPAANLIDSATLVDLGFLFYTPRFEIERSEDRSKALLYFIENGSVVRSYGFDLPALAMLWEKSFAPDDFYFGQNFVQALIDNSGRMVVVLERDNVRNRRKPHFFEIHSFAGTGEMEIQAIYLNDHLTYDVYFAIDNLNNQVVAGGLYAIDNPERAEGLYYLRFSPWTPAEPVLTYNPFDETFLQNLLGRDFRNVDRGLSEVSVTDIVLRHDGGALLIVERNRQLERRTGSTGRVYYDGAARLMVDYYYDEVFIASLHPDGELHWNTILHKKQYSQDDAGMYSSYFLFTTPGTLRILFNDEIKYENTVSEYVINGLGEYNRNSLFSTANLDLRLRFRDAVQIAGNALVIPSERRNRLKLVRLTY